MLFYSQSLLLLTINIIFKLASCCVQKKVSPITSELISENEARHLEAARRALNYVVVTTAPAWLKTRSTTAEKFSQSSSSSIIWSKSTISPFNKILEKDDYFLPVQTFASSTQETPIEGSGTWTGDGTCGKPPAIAGGSVCQTWFYRAANGAKTTIAMYCCESADSNREELDSIKCTEGPDAHWPEPIQCPTKDNLPSPCPAEVTETRPFSPLYGLSLCGRLGGESPLMCTPNNAASLLRIFPVPKHAIIQLHNCWRMNVKPAAKKRLPKLMWDDELAALAERWAAQCAPYNQRAVNSQENDAPAPLLVIPSRCCWKSVGQNLCWSSNDEPARTWSDCINSWSWEWNFWDYGIGANPQRSIVRHYTQVVWQNTTHVGCAMSQCYDGYRMLCFYGPGGNTGKTEFESFAKPYEIAASAVDNIMADKNSSRRGKAVNDKKP